MFRIGQSSDIHRLQEGRKLILGGVEIAHEKGLTHAIAESILGALALGDLGTHFPDTDERWRGVSSLSLLSQVCEMMEAEGYAIGNLDALIMIERPKMAPHIMKMRENIAHCLHCGIGQVSIKATRGEKLGFVGREEGVLAQCAVLLQKEE